MTYSPTWVLRMERELTEKNRLIGTTLNELILGEIETEHYFTLFLAHVDLQSSEVSFVQAGHPCPLVQRASGMIETVGEGGMPVGLLRQARYEPAFLRLSPGDRLLIHSDGITECADANDKLLGDRGLARMMVRLAEIEGPACLDGLIWQLTDHAGGRRFDDDISAALLEFSGDGA